MMKNVSATPCLGQGDGRVFFADKKRVFFPSTWIGKEVMKHHSTHCVGLHGLHSVVVRYRWFTGEFGGKEMKPGFTWSLSVLMVEVMGDGFPDDAGMAGLDVDCDLCSVKADVVFCLCGMLGLC
jgi:hypothetical protein